MQSSVDSGQGGYGEGSLAHSSGSNPDSSLPGNPDSYSARYRASYLHRCVAHRSDRCIVHRSGSSSGRSLRESLVRCLAGNPAGYVHRSGGSLGRSLPGNPASYIHRCIVHRWPRPLSDSASGCGVRCLPRDREDNRADSSLCGCPDSSAHSLLGSLYRYPAHHPVGLGTRSVITEPIPVMSPPLRARPFRKAERRRGAAPNQIKSRRTSETR
jgi:hypothetical protein